MKYTLLSFFISVCCTACALTIHAGVPETRRLPMHFQAGSAEIIESHSDNSANPDSLSSFPNSAKSVPSVNDREETNYITPLQRRYYLKSNAVGWAMLVSNIAFEFDVAERLSVEIPIYFSAMNYFSSKVKFRTAMIQPELRYWFNTSTPSGHTGWYAGVHFGVGHFNYALGGRYRYQDHGGHHPAAGGGLSAGWRTNLDASGRWKMELSAGIGIYATKYDKFENRINGQYVERGISRTFFGIDRAAVSFVYTFGKF
ncbi:MAG: DUF3575 domain-containing protein [Bacteroides sp.]|nr:DUF3575 domain-containing protein [Bacteroides sp.]MCM1457523.1 DUF3575 domain-containing protein [Lachnoclostridium sp.]